MPKTRQGSEKTGGRDAESLLKGVVENCRNGQVLSPDANQKGALRLQHQRPIRGCDRRCPHPVRIMAALTR